MALKTILVALAAARSVTAHFGLVYPEWRADTLSDEEDSEYSQWTYPCAGVDFGAGNFTDWPLTGGSLTLDLHHPWGYLFVNLAIGNGTEDFSFSLTPELHNATSNGTFCVDKLAIPAAAAAEIEDGAFGTLQVVSSGESGNALYNCADIRFSSSARAPGNCSSQVEWVTVGGEEDHDHGDGGDEGSDDSSDESSEGAGAGGDEDAAGMLGVDRLALASIVGFSAAFALGLGF